MTTIHTSLTDLCGKIDQAEYAQLYGLSQTLTLQDFTSRVCDSTLRHTRAHHAIQDLQRIAGHARSELNGSLDHKTVDTLRQSPLEERVEYYNHLETKLMYSCSDLLGDEKNPVEEAIDYLINLQVAIEPTPVWKRTENCVQICNRAMEALEVVKNQT